MPKMKTHKGSAKRFKITGSGKAMHLKPHGKMLRQSARTRPISSPPIPAAPDRDTA